ncbi:MAG: ribosome small subunit-dependent GTPase A [Candidatus Margulisiibacteriota bacterium]|nr:MAG: ribosome small subunit-dependent GTPase A [Candidatus Margulisiibacteriota bacterium]HCY36979.1 ribosome small subunit-dependent GTPase A [Candidatus Margulisiibacteriota bacterium]
MKDKEEYQGLVIKSYCGYFLVHCNEVIYRCRVRGTIDTKEVLVGDYVKFSMTENDEGIIKGIVSRVSSLKKPPVANINQVILVFSADEPLLDLAEIDKFLLIIQQEQVPIVICINKIDLASPQFEAIKGNLNFYDKMGIPVLYASTAEKKGIEELSSKLAGHISIFMGPSGVGKTSLLNIIKNDLCLKVSKVSEKIKRGKHTTRFVELIMIAPDTWVVDSPGFSFYSHKLDPAQLALFYPDFQEYLENCKFADCFHVQEPRCGIKAAVAEGEIAQFRYANYCKILQSLVELERNKYR